jgi:ADP-ribosylation factor-like protein 8
MGAIFTRLLSLFWSKNLDMILVGLDNAGKTTLLNILAHGHCIETVPTVGVLFFVFIIEYIPHLSDLVRFECQANEA